VKKVQAIIREQRLDAVIERLVLTGIRGLTVIPVKGAGRTGGHQAFFFGSAYQVRFISKIMLEWYGPDEDADTVIRAIVRAGSTGAVGDGKVFVETVEEAVRIRTGERGLDAV
jgi:nitrogen regulatory protein P-II 1